MNPTQRNNYSQTTKRVQNRMELLFLPSVYRALRKQISSFTSMARQNGVSYAMSRLPLMDDYIASVIRNIHVKAGLFAARETRSNILQEVARSAAANKKGLALIEVSQSSFEIKRRGFGFNERITADVREYFRLHLLEKAVIPISATTRERIETVLNKAADEGWGVERIVQELESEGFRDMTRRRAQMIVRTETVRAMNYGAMAAANDSEYEQVKEWIAVNDNRTRRTHDHGTGVDGETRDILKPFSNGLMFPGDPNGDAEQTINCRCTLGFRAKRDSRGRLIPKKREGLLISLASQLSWIYRRIAAVLSSF